MRQETQWTTIFWEGWTALALCAAAVFWPGSAALGYPAVLWPGSEYRKKLRSYKQHLFLLATRI